jgi:hypothetical protein
VSCALHLHYYAQKLLREFGVVLPKSLLLVAPYFAVSPSPCEFQSREFVSFHPCMSKCENHAEVKFHTLPTPPLTSKSRVCLSFIPLPGDCKVSFCVSKCPLVKESPANPSALRAELRKRNCASSSPLPFESCMPFLPSLSFSSLSLGYSSCLLSMFSTSHVTYLLLCHHAELFPCQFFSCGSITPTVHVFLFPW